MIAVMNEGTMKWEDDYNRKKTKMVKGTASSLCGSFCSGSGALSVIG